MFLYQLSCNDISFFIVQHTLSYVYRLIIFIKLFLLFYTFYITFYGLQVTVFFHEDGHPHGAFKYL